MDSDRFDQLTKTLSRETGRSRRGVLRTAAGGLLVGLWAAVRGSERTQAQIPPPLCPEWVLARYPWLCEGNEPNQNNNNTDDDNDDDDNKDKKKDNDKKNDTDPCAGVSCDGCLTCEGGECVADAGICPGGQSCVGNGTCAVSCTFAPGGCGESPCDCRELSAGGNACIDLNDCECVDACQDCAAGRVCLVAGGTPCENSHRCCTPCNL